MAQSDESDCCGKCPVYNIISVYKKISCAVAEISRFAAPDMIFGDDGGKIFVFGETEDFSELAIASIANQFAVSNGIYTEFKRENTNIKLGFFVKDFYKTAPVPGYEPIRTSEIALRVLCERSGWDIRCDEEGIEIFTSVCDNENDISDMFFSDISDAKIREIMFKYFRPVKK